MYLEHFGLKTPPFENTPDPRFLYASEDHTEALAGIEYTVRMRKGIVLVSGEIGSGKTIITHVLYQRLGRVATCFLIRQGHTNPEQFLRDVCRAMKLSVDDDADRGEILQIMEEYLVEQSRFDKPVVLIIDEAQMMSRAVLHEVRMLSNIETPRQKLMQIVLLGQPDLRHVLRDPEMDPLRQRVALSHHLNGMSAEHTGRYIAHRLKVAADSDVVAGIFDEPAIEAIYEFTEGIPRMINYVADNCLLVGFVKGAKQIDESIVRHVTQNMMLHNGAGTLRFADYDVPKLQVA
jgi:general secretion pathway protein A